MLSCFCTLQNPGVLQVLQNTVASSDDIFYLNFGRWHYTNCYGLQDGPYRQSLNELGALYQVGNELQGAQRLYMKLLAAAACSSQQSTLVNVLTLRHLHVLLPSSPNLSYDM